MNTLQNNNNNQIARWFSSEVKGGESSSGDVETTTGKQQHEAWVEFQQSIAVSGFETGQTLREKKLGKKKRGGKLDRKRKEREAEMEAALRGEDVTQVS